MRGPRRVIALALLLACTVPTACSRGQSSGRQQQWREDLQALATELPRLHKNLFFRLPRADFERSVAALQARLPSLQEHEVIAEMMRIVASVGDAHTTLSPWPKPWSRFFPLRVHWFADGLYVTGTTQAYRAALGARVVKIGDTPIAAARAAVADLIPHDNDAQLMQHSPTYLVSPEVLCALGILPDVGRARYAFRNAKGRTFALNVTPISQGKSIKWVGLPDATKVPIPLYLRETKSAYWAEYLKDSQTLYVQYNRCQNMEALPFAAFTRKLVAVLDAHPVRRFVIDLRHNSGGNSTLLRPLVGELKKRPEVNRKGTLFAIVGRRTFSSAVLNAIQLRNETNVIIAGEPTGGRPNHYGEVRSFSLPNSGLRVTYSTKYFAHSSTDTPSLMPDLTIRVSSSDYFAGRDPVLEAILRRPAP